MNSFTPMAEVDENHQNSISIQIKAVGNLAYLALNPSVVADIGDQQDQHQYVGKVASAVSVLCQSILMQISAGASIVVQANATGRAALEISRIGDSIRYSLEEKAVAAHGSAEEQRAYIDYISETLKENCDSIVEDLRSENSEDLV